jgi:hypothetical protein
LILYKHQSQNYCIKVFVEDPIHNGAYFNVYHIFEDILQNNNKSNMMQNNDMEERLQKIEEQLKNYRIDSNIEIIKLKDELSNKENKIKLMRIKIDDMITLVGEQETLRNEKINIRKEK